MAKHDAVKCHQCPKSHVGTIPTCELCVMLHHLMLMFPHFVALGTTGRTFPQPASKGAAMQTSKGTAMQINRVEDGNIPGGCKSHHTHASAEDSFAQQHHAWFADRHDLHWQCWLQMIS